MHTQGIKGDSRKRERHKKKNSKGAALAKPAAAAAMDKM